MLTSARKLIGANLGPQIEIPARLSGARAHGR